MSSFEKFVLRHLANAMAFGRTMLASRARGLEGALTLYLK